MRSDFARCARDCRTFSFHSHDDASQPYRLSQTGNESIHAARAFTPARCNGDNAQAGDGATGLGRVADATRRHLGDSNVRKASPIRQLRNWNAEIGIILGSGLNAIVQNPIESIDYAEFRELPKPRVSG